MFSLFSAHTLCQRLPGAVQVQQLLAAPAAQQLLARCREPSSLILLLPPYDGGEAGPVDDGVRLTTPTAVLTAVFERLMLHLCVPNDVLRGRTVEERVTEVLCLAGVALQPSV